MTINDLKVNIISIISNLQDMDLLNAVYHNLTVKSELQDTPKGEIDFTTGITQIRSKVSKDSIFEEQGNKTITYTEIKTNTNDIVREHSLEEMLDSLN